MGEGRGTGGRSGQPRRPLRLPFLAALLLALLIPAAALAQFGQFPGNPDESPRDNTPNDPSFDRCELDDPDTGPGDCDTYFEEDFRLFGFSPDSANMAPNPGGPPTHAANGTRYADCSQLDPQGRQANREAERMAGVPPNPLAECLQIAGIRADTAFKYSTGDPDVAVAILDTGIRWEEEELVDKVRLNRAELPLPRMAGGGVCAAYDCTDPSDDGAFSVSDYADDARVSMAAGDTESDGILDASDLIATFSASSFAADGKRGGIDDDGNGFVDDIAGWDFFDDDNDPFDASSCCSAEGHGTDRAAEAAAETNEGVGSPGVCPECQVMPLRVWDTFVVPTDNFAMATVYAADNGASVVEGAVGGLTNTQFARRAFTYADGKGVALTLVSSDINSANHNYPTNYNEAIYVGGSLPDTAPNNTCSGPGGLPGVGDLPGAPGEFQDGCNEFLGFLAGNGVAAVTPSSQPITTSFFRNANLTQYGGKADVVLVGATGSANTGQASGAAALLASFGRERFGDGDPLSGNEIRQLLTMTAEDVLPANTGAIGTADKANAGWDDHFGYGRVNLAGAMARIANDRGPAPPKGSPDPFAWPCPDTDATCVPPEAQIDAPDWFTPINVDRVPAAGVVVEGLAAAPHSNNGVGAWELEYACGQDALDSDFEAIPGGGISGTGPIDGVLGRLPKSLIADLAANCDGQVLNDAGRPAGGAGDGTGNGAWPVDPFPEPDPERHAFQIRLTVHEAGNPANIGRYRKTLHAYADDGNLPGWPRPLGTGSDASRYVTGSGGEVSPRLYDLDGDNALDMVQGTSSGELHVLRADGTPLPSFNGGQPVTTSRYETERNHPIPPAVGATPHESLRVPAIGDIDADREPEIVATAGERVYAWETDGTMAAGFPVRIDPARSEPCEPGVPKPCFDAADRAITGDNHIKRGIFGSPALADLDGDGRLDIVTGAMDQHVYAWDGTGDPLPGFPTKLATDGAAGAEIVASPAIAELDGDDAAEIVIATNEVIPAAQEFPDDFFGFFGAALRASTGSNPVYAIDGDGSPVPGGWPFEVPVAAGDLLPLVLPSHDAAILDTDDDGIDEVSVSAGTGVIGPATAGAGLVQADGTTFMPYSSAAGNLTDGGAILNLADYPSIGDLSGMGRPLVLKGGLTANGAANLLAVNQNLPFNHVEQAFDPETGASQPGFPRATDDFQLVSQASVATVVEPTVPPAQGDEAPAQALVGTGLYQVHAYGPDGIDAAGWPKFTGGWTQTTPAVGDADGDGDLDVSVVTREGWSFLWDTKSPACAGANDEWASFHHDEFSSANYGTDARPPGTVRIPSAQPLTNGAANLAWITPGDDWLCGNADRYEVRVSASRITRPSQGREVFTRGTDGEAGNLQTDTLSTAQIGDARFVGILYRDDAGNWGRVRSIPLDGSENPGSGGNPAAPIDPPGSGVGGGPGGGGACLSDIDGTGAADRLSGSVASERIRGRSGNDRIFAGAGDDCVNAGAGNDRVSGQAGDDQLKGQNGGDRLNPGDGRDLVRAGAGGDRISARDGERDRLRCGKGRDRVRADRSDRVAKDCERVKRR